MEKAKILIVEDESIVAMDLETRLQKMGYKVVGIETSSEGGLRSVKKNKPDLVLLDIVIDGEKDGIETAYLIRENHAIPIIFLTSHSDLSTFNKAKLTNPYGYVLKPFEENDLLARIEIALHKSKIEQELQESREALAITNEFLENEVAKRTKRLSDTNRRLMDEIVMHEKTMAELITSEERYKWLFDNSMDAIIAISKKGKVEYFNPTAEKMFGYNLNEMKGEGISKLIPLPHAAKHDEYLKIYRRSGKGKTVVEGREVEAKRKDGTILQIEIRVHEGKIKGETQYIGFIKDISNAKKIEGELHKERQLRLSAIIDGQELERKRLSRELHDGIGQMLLGIKLNVGRIVEEERRRKEVELRKDETISLINNTMREVKRISQNLSPSILEDFGLKPALRKMAAMLSDSSGILVKFKARGVTKRFTRELETGIYRIAQESTNNAIRHGKATVINISLTKIKEGYSLKVEDNGISFDSKKLGRYRGHGIYNMYERAALLNGELVIDSKNKRGTNVIFKFSETKI